ncbi:MAG TPA: MoaD/ThiS family protein [Planctomycetaceae bacterium]
MPTEPRAVAVRLFAAAKDRAGAEVVTVRVPAAARIGDVRAALGASVPGLRPLVPYLLFAVGTEYAADDAAVPESGEVVAFPPVSGG